MATRKANSTFAHKIIDLIICCKPDLSILFPSHLVASRFSHGPTNFSKLIVKFASHIWEGVFSTSILFGCLEAILEGQMWGKLVPNLLPVPNTSDTARLCHSSFGPV